LFCFCCIALWGRLIICFCVGSSIFQDAHFNQEEAGMLFSALGVRGLSLHTLQLEGSVPWFLPLRVLQPISNNLSLVEIDLAPKFPYLQSLVARNKV